MTKDQFAGSRERHRVMVHLFNSFRASGNLIAAEAAFATATRIFAEIFSRG